MPIVDVAKLLLNFFQIKMEKGEAIRDFIFKFNRSVSKILLTSQPTENNQLCVFIAAMQTEIRFLLLHLKVQRLQDAQREAVSLDDDMIISRIKCAKPSQAEIYIYEHQHYLKVKLAQRRLVLKKAKLAFPVSSCQNLIVFNDQDFLMPPVFENNPHNVVGAYHLHVEYDEDLQEPTSTENDCLDIGEGCCLHV